MIVKTTRTQIDQFLALKRIAIVGVSRNPKDFTRALYTEFQKRGYDVVPVNPNMDNIDGTRCIANVRDIQPVVKGVLIMTSPQQTDQIIRDSAAAGIKRVWLHRGEGIGAVGPKALALCTEYHLDVVAGFCPFMFMPDSAFFHRAHGFVKKITGSYPVEA
jgi:predicted CoA-binding protein